MKEENSLILYICSVLLEYPNSEIIDSVKEIEEIMKALPANKSDLIRYFINYLKAKNLIEIQENYVSTFDLNESNSLYLSYHLYKDEVERGIELLNLKQTYEKEGYTIEKSELADYLPLILEFLSISKTGKNDFINKYVPVLIKIKNNLEKNNNPYRYLFQACIEAIQSEKW